MKGVWIIAEEVEIDFNFINLGEEMDNVIEVNNETYGSILRCVNDANAELEKTLRTVKNKIHDGGYVRVIEFPLVIEREQLSVIPKFYQATILNSWNKHQSMKVSIIGINLQCLRLDPKAQEEFKLTDEQMKTHELVVLTFVPLSQMDREGFDPRVKDLLLNQ